MHCERQLVAHHCTDFACFCVFCARPAVSRCRVHRERSASWEATRSLLKAGRSGVSHGLAGLAPPYHESSEQRLALRTARLRAVAVGVCAAESLLQPPSELQQYLPEFTWSLEKVEGLCRVGQREDSVDDWPEAAARKKRHHLAGEGLDRYRFLL